MKFIEKISNKIKEEMKLDADEILRETKNRLSETVEIILKSFLLSLKNLPLKK